MLMKLLTPAPAALLGAAPRRSSCSSSRSRSPRCTCRPSTPTSSTTASRQGDTGFIISTGGVMLGITLVQVACAIAAVYFGAKAAMALGRDLRAARLRPGRRLLRARGVARSAPPSLITRTTNDVQQVQMLVLMIVHAPRVGADPRDRRRRSWRSREDLDALVAHGRRACRCCSSSSASSSCRMVPLFQSMQKRIDGVNRVLREQLTGIRVIRAFVREDVETRALRRGERRAHRRRRCSAGRLFALMFPIVMLVLNVSSVAVLWFGAFRVEDGSMQVGSLDRVPQLPHADPHGRDDGDLHGRS